MILLMCCWILFASILLRIFIYLFIYLFMAVLGLNFCARAFSSCGKRGATLHRSALASHYRGLSLRSTGSRHAGSVIVAHGLVAPRHVGSSQTRAQTRVPCISRQILNHCATREALLRIFASMFISDIGL